MKVLIVDDSAIIRNSLQSIIQKQGYEVLGQAANGLDALRLFEELEPDLVTMDITMPEMDGLSCVEAMLGQRPDAKIVVISALASKEVALKAIELGAREFIKKPYDVDELVACLNTLKDC